MRVIAHTERLLRKFERMEASLRDQGLRKIGQYGVELLETDTLKAFDTSSDVETGTPWPPRKYTPQWSWGTRRGRLQRRARRPWKLLIKTGTLRRGSRGKARVSGGKLRLLGVVSGNAAEYAEAHQFGTQRIPRRRYIGMTPTSVERLKRFAERVIAQA